MAPNYHNANSPYGSGDPYYNESSGYITPMPLKKKTSLWLKIGIPVAICVIVAAVVGGVGGSRHHSSSSSVSGGAASGGSSGDQAAAASSAASVKNAIGVFALLAAASTAIAVTRAAIPSIRSVLFALLGLMFP